MSNNRRARPGNATLAVAYLRLSPARAADARAAAKGHALTGSPSDRLGFAAQRAAIDRWAHREGVTIVAWHEDRVPGATEIAARPALVAALLELRAAGAGVLVAARRDRLARDVFVAAMLERAVAAAGARVMTVEGANGDGPAEVFQRTIQDAGAEFERALIRARTKAALAAKAAKGERTGTIPWGWRTDGGALEVDERERAITAAVLELRRAGMPLRAIVATLAARGVTGRSGKPLGLTGVARLVSRKR